MKTRRTPSMAQLARNLVGTRDRANEYASPANLPPRPAWLKLGARVALPGDVLGAIFEIRPTADGETWEVACMLPGGQSANRRYRLTEIALWEPAPNDRNTCSTPTTMRQRRDERMRRHGRDCAVPSPIAAGRR